MVAHQPSVDHNTCTVITAYSLKYVNGLHQVWGGGGVVQKGNGVLLVSQGQSFVQACIEHTHEQTHNHDQADAGACDFVMVTFMHFAGKRPVCSIQLASIVMFYKPAAEYSNAKRPSRHKRR